MSREFQIEIKIGLTGNQYIQKLREEGKLPNPSDIDRIKLDIIRLWLFRKEDIIRGKELYRRKILTVVNKPKKFKKYEVTEKLKMMALKQDINLLV